MKSLNLRELGELGLLVFDMEMEEAVVQESYAAQFRKRSRL